MANNKRTILEEATHALQLINPFYGSLLSCIEVQVTDRVPTAGVCYDSKLKKVRLAVNSDFFEGLTVKEQVALLQHELMHITHKHIFTDLGNKVPRERIKMNMASDLVINQLINNLPKGALLVQNFKDGAGNPYKLDMTTEHYLSLLEQSETKESGKGNEKGDEQGQWKKVKDILDEMEKNGETVAFDEHGWEEGTPLEKLAAVKSLVQRAVNKDKQHSYDAGVKDLLDYLKVKMRELNYKSLLRLAIRQSLPSKTRQRTWKRLNRRYEEFAKGRSKGRQCKLDIFIDCSGSISQTEVNEALGIVEGFLGAGVEECHVNLFHTTNFYRNKFKKGFKVDDGVFESGGTELTDSFNVAIKSNPDLCLFITDGYWSIPSVDLSRIPNCLFLITKDGTLEHPLANKYKTIQY